MIHSLDVLFVTDGETGANNGGSAIPYGIHVPGITGIDPIITYLTHIEKLREGTLEEGPCSLPDADQDGRLFTMKLPDGNSAYAVGYLSDEHRQRGVFFILPGVEKITEDLVRRIGNALSLQERPQPAPIPYILPPDSEGPSGLAPPNPIP